MAAPRRSHAVRRSSLLAVPLAAAALLAPAGAGAAPVKVGSVFTETNATTGNQVVAFDRFSDGTLGPARSFDTGGVGAPSPFRCNLPPSLPPCEVTDSQGAVSLTPAGTLLFVVNAGSDTISSLRVHRDGLELVGQVASGGSHPVSVANHGRLLYVLNQASGNIAGFTFNGRGRLTPIPGSTQPLSTPGLAGNGAQVSFGRSGRSLVVTEPGVDVIDTFVLTDGVPSAASSHPSPAHGPFGFAFDNLGHLVVSDAGLPPMFEGNVSTYGETAAGALTPIQTQSAGGAAPCWLVITPDNRYVYIANLVSKSISRFRLGTDGRLTLLGVTPTLDVPTFPLVQDNADLALSRDGRFLYALVQSFYGGNISRIDEYRIGSGGDLTLLGSTPQNMPAGTAGLAAL